MLEMIMERRHTDISGKHDLLSSLLDANDTEDGGGLTDSELMGVPTLFCFFPVKPNLNRRKYFFGWS